MQRPAILWFRTHRQVRGMCTYVEQPKGVIILLSHIRNLAGVFYERPKPFQLGIVLKSRYIAQHQF